VGDLVKTATIGQPISVKRRDQLGGLLHEYERQHEIGVLRTLQAGQGRCGEKSRRSSGSVPNQSASVSVMLEVTCENN
jgi:hypothetical protein